MRSSTRNINLPKGTRLTPSGFSLIELVIVVVMVFVASFMARGFGLK